MDQLGVDARTTSGFNPQANGQAERTNQNLRQYLRVASKRNNGNWVSDIDICEMVINNTAIGNSKLTPLSLNLGYHPYVIPDSLWLSSTADLKHQNADLLADTWRNTWAESHQILQKLKDSSTEYANRSRREATFQAGDLVWVRMSQLIETS